MKKTDTPKDNVIDMTERIAAPDYRARLKNLKVRFDLEQAKIAVSTSLLSVVILVTMANSNLLSAHKEAAAANTNTRGIASIPTGTSDAEDGFVKDMAHRTLSAEAAGHRSSAIESLAYGTLEGKYAVHLLNGKVSQLEFSRHTSQPTLIQDYASFLESNRDVLPVAFNRSLKVGHDVAGDSTIETYQLVDRVSRSVARVRFQVDSSGRLLTMDVVADSLSGNSASN